MMTINPEQLERLGKLADRADSFFHATMLALPAAVHVKALTEGMESLRDETRELYREVSGEDPWTN